MQRFAAPMLVLTAILLAAACGAGDPGSHDAQGDHAQGESHAEEADHAPLPERVRVAADVAREIESRPDEAEEILAAHEMTAESFEQLMYEIAADPELSRAYQAATRKAIRVREDLQDLFAEAATELDTNGKPPAN